MAKAVGCNDMVFYRTLSRESGEREMLSFRALHVWESQGAGGCGGLEELRPSVLQSHGTEFCQHPVSLEDDPQPPMRSKPW